MDHCYNHLITGRLSAWSPFHRRGVSMEANRAVTTSPSEVTSGRRPLGAVVTRLALMTTAPWGRLGRQEKGGKEGGGGGEGDEAMGWGGESGGDVDKGGGG